MEKWWKINILLERRSETTNGSDKYKSLTKELKKRENHLRNEILESQAKEINRYEIRKNTEKLFRDAQKDNSSFKKIKQRKDLMETVIKSRQEHISVFCQKALTRQI